MNNSIIQAVRAIGAEQIRRVTRLVVLLTTGVSVALIALLAWVSDVYSDWWWIFIIPIVIIGSIIAVLCAVLWAISYLIMPRELTRQERKQIHTFTDRLFVAAAAAQVSRAALVFLVIKDALQGKHFSNRIQRVLDEGRGLRDDFAAIQKLF